MVDINYPNAIFASFMDKGRKRHIAKAMTWRIVASLTTFFLTIFFFKEDPNATQKALGVALMESAFKMVLYYYHERVWFINQTKFRSSVRHLLKTVTWRVIASIVTFLIALAIFNQDQYAMEKASGIAMVEIFLKIGLYYLHERVWLTQNFGLASRKEKVNKS